jgi:uncharacterized protein YbaA (DUF1428 family)
MYIAVLIIPVPEANMDAYHAWAVKSASIFKKYGCLEVVDGWEDFVPTGKQTDFFRAVAARNGEKIVVSWQVWPDRERFYASESRMHEDNALEVDGEIPFDASRLVYGCFKPIHVMGRLESIGVSS